MVVTVLRCMQSRNLRPRIATEAWGRPASTRRPPRRKPSVDISQLVGEGNVPTARRNREASLVFVAEHLVGGEGRLGLHRLLRQVERLKVDFRRHVEEGTPGRGPDRGFPRLSVFSWPLLSALGRRSTLIRGSSWIQAQS